MNDGPDGTILGGSNSGAKYAYHYSRIGEGGIKTGVSLLILFYGIIQRIKAQANIWLPVINSDTYLYLHYDS